MNSGKGDVFVENTSPRRLTLQILKDVMVKSPGKMREIPQIHISKLQHTILSFQKERALETVDDPVGTAIRDMEFYENKFTEIIRIMEDLPLLSTIVSCIDDIWQGYQHNTSSLYGYLMVEVDLVQEEVNVFKRELDTIQHAHMQVIGTKSEDYTFEIDENTDSDPERSSTSDMEQSKCLPDIENENVRLMDEVSRLQKENANVVREQVFLREKISELSSSISETKLEQSYLTPRPVASLDDLTSILGDGRMAENASSMAQTLYSKGDNIKDYVLKHFNRQENDLEQDCEEYNTLWEDILEVQCDPNILTDALERRVGPTKQKFEFLESKYINLQRENMVLRDQIISFQEVEKKRSLARQRHEEEVHSEKKSSLQRYLDMLGDKGEDAWKDQLIGMGAGGDVPKIFRFVGKIRNKHMSKRDTEKLVREVWKDRSTSVTGKSTSLLEFLGNHLQKKVGIAAAVLELGYNFLFSLWKYQWDADCELFLKILVGDTREEVYIAQNNLKFDLEELFEALDKANGLATGYIPKEELIIALRVYFRVGKLDGKSEKRFEEALHALDLDQPGAQVEWRKVFEEDREFNQGEFAECIRDQFLIEREELYDAIGVALYEECGEDNSCSCQQLEYALYTARPSLGAKATYHAKALFETTEEEKLNISIALKFLSERSLELDEEDCQQSLQRKQKTDKPGLGKTTKQAVLQKRQNPLIASALEEVRLYWMTTTC